MKKEIKITDNLPAYYAAPDGEEKLPGVIVVHEIWGMTPHIKNVADRIAKEGYVVIVPNLFADVEFEKDVDQSVLAEMKDPATRDAAQQKMRKFLAPINAPGFAKETLKKLANAYHHLSKDERVSGNIGMVGFCWGGTYTFAFAAKEPTLKAAVPFYGHRPDAEKIATIMAPILAFYGEDDAPLMEELPAFRDEMAKQGKTFEAISYPATGHAFFNDTNPVLYRPESAKDAWEKMMPFLKKNLG